MYNLSGYSNHQVLWFDCVPPKFICWIITPQSDGNIKVTSLGSAWVFLNTKGMCSLKNSLYNFENCFPFIIITKHWLYSLCILEHPGYTGSVVAERGLALQHMGPVS